MALMIDSVTPAAIPKGTPVVAGYVDGPYGPADPFHSGWEPASWNEFPGSLMVTITVAGAAGARVYDIESGDGTPAQGVAWCRSEIRALRRPCLYANASTWSDELDGLLAAVGLYRGTNIDGWVAQYNNQPVVPPGFVAHQYLANQPGVQGSYIDYSQTNGIWPLNKPIPGPVPVPSTSGENDMIARNTKGSGYWAVRANANVYTYNGAQYIGPLPKYTAAWGIGTASNPVVGITDDGAGGFVLETDPPGGSQPNLYHITADGAFAK